MMEWLGTIKGPDGSVYEGLSFKLLIKFPATYPFAAPTITFTTPCFHPNVDAAGNICLDILKGAWAATYNTRTVLLSLQSLLSDPNNADPLNLAAAQMWSRTEEFRKVVLAKHGGGSK